MRTGWGNIWKQKTIWIFGALPILYDIFRFYLKQLDLYIFWQLLNLVGSSFDVVLFFVSIIGVPYNAYRFATGETTDFQTTMSAVKKFGGRIVGCSCLSVIVTLVFLGPLLLFFADRSANPPELPRLFVLATSLLGFISGIVDIAAFEFFAGDRGIWETIKNATKLFISHFQSLAILGGIVTLIVMGISFFIAAVIVGIQSGFDMEAIMNIDFILPGQSIPQNIFCQLMVYVEVVIMTVFRSSAFAAAYQKYAGIKPADA